MKFDIDLSDIQTRLKNERLLAKRASKGKDVHYVVALNRHNQLACYPEGHSLLEQTFRIKNSCVIPFCDAHKIATAKKNIELANKKYASVLKRLYNKHNNEVQQ